MKKIMRGVLLFGMLGGMLLSCGSKKEENNSQNQAQAKSEEKVFKIGIGQIVDHPALNDARQGFKDALNKAGVKAEFEETVANGEMATQTLQMQQFLKSKKDLVYAITTPTSQAAKSQITDIPVVIAAVTDPQGAGLVGVPNITGTSGAAPTKENLEMIRKLG